MDEATLTKIEEASGWLASLRNTAFYVEETYSAEEAGRACEEAKFVYAAIEDHFKL